MKYGEKCQISFEMLQELLSDSWQWWIHLRELQIASFFCPHFHWWGFLGIYKKNFRVFSLEKILGNTVLCTRKNVTRHNTSPSHLILFGYL